MILLVKTKKRIIKILVLTLAMILSLLTLGLSFYNQQQRQQRQQFFIKQQQEQISQLKWQKEELLKILEKQPTHRDTLINLSILSCQLEQWDDCNNYFNQAKKLDPNNPFFKNFSPFPKN